MARLRGILMIGGLLTALLLAPQAEAADGRIVFSGAIVAATCLVGDQSAAEPASGMAMASRSGRCVPLTPAAEDGPSYHVEVSGLQGGAGNPLLAYFAGYAGGASPRMMTQTYD